MVFIGPFDPIKLIFEIINTLIKKYDLSEEEAKRILKNSLDPSMSEEEKNKLVDSLFIKKDNKK